MKNGNKSLCIKCGDINWFNEEYGGVCRCSQCGFTYSKEGKEYYKIRNIMNRKGKEDKEMQKFITKLNK